MILDLNWEDDGFIKYIYTRTFFMIILKERLQDKNKALIIYIYIFIYMYVAN